MNNNHFEVLELLNQLHEAKLSNNLSPVQFKSTLAECHKMLLNGILKGKLSKESIERYMVNVPSNSSIFLYNHMGLKGQNVNLNREIINLQYSKKDSEDKVSYARRVA